MAKKNPPAEVSDWKDTALWNQLLQVTSTEGDVVRTTLKSPNCLPAIQNILAQGGTALANFTLHDSGHAFRVAERMAEIIPPDVLPELSPFELALLLLSAYLHDIGMTPERRKVTDHYEFLLTGSKGDLTEEEVTDFQAWLDDKGDGIEPPLAKDTTTPETLTKANELIAYYSRSRHNDWSEEWIRENLKSLKMSNYVGWINDLVTLCRSHHEGIQELLSKQFDPRPAISSKGSTKNFVHLRYLAAVLRLADVLENDPERTPDVILRHRNVSHTSLMYWHKDHEFHTILNENRIAINARPKSAKGYRAILECADEIEGELRVCHQLSEQAPFEIFGQINFRLPHRWDISPYLDRKIQSDNQAFEFIDGMFRVDNQKILELLGGISLYQNPLVAVRELLQNAFDGVKEEIARERLLHADPVDVPYLENLRKLHSVTLDVVEDDGDIVLICKDTGAGMTKEIICDHLLNSGRARRSDIQELERRCKEKGFSVDRTGQFGIGALSYFMLAAKVQYLTRRSQSSGGTDNVGWKFVTEGVDDFGELKRDDTIIKGTEIKLTIHKERFQNGQEFTEELKNYLNETLLYVPCTFHFRSRFDAVCIDLQPGWILTEDHFSDWQINELNSHFQIRWRVAEIPDSLVSKEYRGAKSRLQNYQEEVTGEIAKSLRWIKKSGNLEGKLLYRIHIPYFELEGGVSLGFFRSRRNGKRIEIKRIESGQCFVPRGYRVSSWHGIPVSLHEEGEFRRNDYRIPLGVAEPIIEVNWISSSTGTLSVNRQELIISDKAKALLSLLEGIKQKMYSEFIDDHRGSAFAFLNAKLARVGAKSQQDMKWLFKADQTNEFTWKTVQLPVVSPTIGVMGNGGGRFWSIENEEPVWRQKKLGVPVGVRLEMGAKTIHWNDHEFPPSSVVQIASGEFAISTVWSHRKQRSVRDHPLGETASFPPPWGAMLGCCLRLDRFDKNLGEWFIWNKEHQVVRRINAKYWEWAEQTFGEAATKGRLESLDPLKYKEDLLKHPGRAAAWIAMICKFEAFPIWEGLLDRAPDFLDHLWGVVFDSTENKNAKKIQQILYWTLGGKFAPLLSLSPTGIRGFMTSAEIKRELRDPGPDWTIQLRAGQ